MGQRQAKPGRSVQAQDSWQRRSTMPPSASDKAAADRLRLEGNQCFAKGKYAAALEASLDAALEPACTCFSVTLTFE